MIASLSDSLASTKTHFDFPKLNGLASNMVLQDASLKFLLFRFSITTRWLEKRWQIPSWLNGKAHENRNQEKIESQAHDSCLDDRSVIDLLQQRTQKISRRGRCSFSVPSLVAHPEYECERITGPQWKLFTGSNLQPEYAISGTMDAETLIGFAAAAQTMESLTSGTGIIFNFTLPEIRHQQETPGHDLSSLL
ncbi:hypothetical protein LSTR_LSTR001564 [Laodelphax striatellus]|uniref:Uncharacterized protein n=1 Tax=Laodelphax striatellus TaxID=195883 RepID=A0A482XC88_LAOST|nr:hypothetical protein LSTR_LSTR001564 [Laodelphax striatellus]